MKRLKIDALKISHAQLRKILGNKILTSDAIILRPSNLRNRKWLNDLTNALYEANFSDRFTQSAWITVMRGSLGCLLPIVFVIGMSMFLGSRHIRDEDMSGLAIFIIGIFMSAGIHKFIRKKLFNKWRWEIYRDVRHYMKHLRPTRLGSILDEIDTYNPGS